MSLAPTESVFPAPRVVEARGLVKEYRGRKVVDGVSLTFQQGEVVGLLGPNGAGKTTSFYMIVGQIRPSAGEVLLDDKPITKLPMYRRARLGIGYLAQEASIFRKLTVRDNILLVLEMTGCPASERRARADELLSELNMLEKADSKGYVLSGGERRRVEIARALAADPSFLLLDEPFAGIDPKAIEDIQDVIRQLKARNIGILITDHNVRETLGIVDKAYVLVDGKVIAEGDADEIATDDLVRKHYLGEGFRR